MASDELGTLLHEAAAGPVAALDHDELRRRARGRTRSTWVAAGVAVLATVVGVGALVVNLAAPTTIDVADAPGAQLGPGERLSGLPALPVTLDLPAAGEVAAAHVGERPVFVVHRDTGDVLVVDAVSPHEGEGELPKVVAFCRTPWVFESQDGQTAVTTPGEFRDLWHGSLFALDGAWLGGPAPTGLPTYEVRAVDGETVEVGLPSTAPARDVGPFPALLGTRDGITGRPVDGGASDCATQYDQTRTAAPPTDPTAVVWHEPAFPDRWRYPFAAAEAAAERLGPLVEGERPTSQQPTQGAPVDAALIILAFLVAIAAFATYLRRREADGSLDAGPSSVSRPGLRRLFDFGPGGWSQDGRNQPPKD